MCEAVLLSFLSFGVDGPLFNNVQWRPSRPLQFLCRFDPNGKGKPLADVLFKEGGEGGRLVGGTFVVAPLHPHGEVVVGFTVGHDFHWDVTSCGDEAPGSGPEGVGAA